MELVPPPQTEPGPPAERSWARRVWAGWAGRLRSAPRRWVAAGVAGLVVVAGAGVFVVLRVTATGPDDVVRDYLTAVHDRRVGAAFRAAGVSRLPSGDEAALLTPKAIGQDWKVGKVATEIHSSGEYEVAVALTLTRGSLDAGWISNAQARGEDHGRPALYGRFTVRRTADRWRIVNPFVKVSFLDSPVRFLEVNRARIPRRAVSAGASAESMPAYYMFPGFYQTYAAMRGAKHPAVALDAWRLAVLPSGESTMRAAGPPLALTASGVAQFQQSVNTYVDGCLAEYGAPAPRCRISYLDQSRAIEYRGHHYENLTNPRWKVVSYPTMVQIAQSPGAVLTGPTLGLAQAVPAVLHLTIDGTRVDGGPPTAITQTCVTRAIAMVATIESDGSLRTTWPAGKADSRTDDGGTATQTLELDCKG